MRAATVLVEEFKSALQDYLATGEEAALHHGYELGRRALRDGLGIVELTALHHEALGTLLLLPEALRHGAQALRRGQEFLLEVLSPFEMASRQFQEAIAVHRRLNERLEDESRRIAHALHDEAAQMLVSVHIALDLLAREVPASARERLRAAKDLLNEIQLQIRRLSHELRPTVLDDMGLIPGLEFLAEGMSARIGIPIKVAGSIDGRLPHVVEIALYRIVKEALSNVARHAAARSAVVEVHQDDAAVHCSVRDNGIGFDESAAMSPQRQRGLGLLGIRERLAALGGNLKIVSAPGRGTELQITIPLGGKDADPDHPA
jgi:signal transduction histidine kinase